MQHIVFKISFICLLLNFQNTNAERCKYVLQNIKGNIKSPGYPSKYPGNLDCSWLIQAQDGYTITLKIDSFRLDGPYPSCEQDYLMIYDGHNASSYSFHSPYCERNAPTTLLSSGKFMFFRFVTDSVGSFSGFNIEYKAEPNCNHTINADNGTISSPRYPNEYYSKANCNWHITTRQGTYILLQFRDFLMEGSAGGYDHCYDHVSIYDVVNSGKKLLKTFCGDKIPGSVQSTNNQMILTLYSDATIAARGFLAYFSAQETLKATTTVRTIQKFQCNETQFKCDNGKCIDMKLRCNQIADCTNDELNCAASCSIDNGGCEQKCLVHSVWGPYCSCNYGYALKSDKYSCQDIDECMENNGDCGDICTNYPGGFKCECSSGGFQIGADGKSCQDIDECLDHPPCRHECENTNGSYRCKCRKGYRMSSSGNCFDINECAIGVPGCYDCINTDGSYYCKCGTGFIEVENSTRCEEINECKSNNGGCSHNCTNTFGSFYCHCTNGFKPEDESAKKCLDIDECSKNNGGCQQLCINNQGSYTCKCYNGFKLINKTCIDVNECSTFNSCHYKCINTIGSFKCECPKDYVIGTDGQSCFKQVNDSECGLPDVNSTTISTAKWPKAKFGSWTWQAYISYKVGFLQGIRFGCMATLISRKYLLTTAHCVYMMNGVLAPSQLLVYLGVMSKNMYANKWSYEVDRIIIHPDYQRKNFKQSGDLALIKLKKEILKTSLKIQPICFHQSKPVEIGKKVDFITWGRISEKSFSNELRQLKVEIKDRSFCSWLSAQRYDYSKMLCGGFPKIPNRQNCLPDSGSPIMIQNGKNHKWFLVGMLVHGAGYPKQKSCSSEYRNNAFYDLAQYYKWIVEKTETS